MELLAPTRSTAQAVQTKRIGARDRKKSAKVVAAAGGRPSREQQEDDPFVLMEELTEDEVDTVYGFADDRDVEFDHVEVMRNSWRL